jgi:hypothetical protein
MESSHGTQNAESPVFYGQLWRVASPVGERPIPRPIGEDLGGVINTVHHSPVKIWAGGLRAA